MAENTIIKAVTGLNNKVDPVRLQYNPENGVSELAEATNITIDVTGRPQRRLGWNLKVSGDFHSVWCDSGDAFCVQETPTWGSIMQIASDFSVSGVLSGLSKFKPMSFLDFNGVTYYANDVQKGKIVDGISAEWSTAVYHDANTTRQFIPVPTGKHIFRHGTRIGVVVGNTIWFSEPDIPGLFDSRSYWSFPSDVKMAVSVTSGVFVSDSKRTYFLAGTGPHNFHQSPPLSKYPAHEYSVCTERLESGDIGTDEEAGAAVWSSLDGLCAGLASGKLINLTRQKLDYPDGYHKAASLLCGYHVINTMY